MPGMHREPPSIPVIEPVLINEGLELAQLHGYRRHDRGDAEVWRVGVADVADQDHVEWTLMFASPDEMMRLGALLSATALGWEQRRGDDRPLVGGIRR